MPTTIRNLKTVDDSSFPYVFEKNIDVPLKAGGLVRANVYRPKAPGRYPVLCTYGPYGKDVYYGEYFQPNRDD
jgi:predicted acyl esterase